ncbi:LRR receptor-like serine/threonine-protein kinase ghr1 [Stylosanthes scabra]|uniref:LRR receptor-like serine/threonine-protein kinase ghr1 n=1 Tax=Stylosanthes scabra TaxID=79078 RepID=A0ABU6UH35_9FABA|nr:LRR receptor-like serine/threonine-protein kinase ghr1 [Stylosanthes scabra]
MDHSLSTSEFGSLGVAFVRHILMPFNHKPQPRFPSLLRLSFSFPFKLLAGIEPAPIGCSFLVAGTVEQILDAGVLGYRAPELAASKKPMPSFKSDVYAFGVILLELLTGRCAGDVISGEEGGVDLTDWVRLRVSEGRGSDCFDATLMPELSNPVADKGMKEVLGIAIRCIRSVSERPGIKTIYEELSSV